jgi:hypothetical protein
MHYRGYTARSNRQRGQGAFRKLKLEPLFEASNYKAHCSLRQCLSRHACCNLGKMLCSFVTTAISIVTSNFFLTVDIRIRLLAMRTFELGPAD